MDLERIANLVVLVAGSVLIFAVAIRMGGRWSRSANSGSTPVAGHPDTPGVLERPDGSDDELLADMIGETGPKEEMVTNMVPAEEHAYDVSLAPREEGRVLGVSSESQGSLDGGGAGDAKATAVPYCFKCSRKVDPYGEVCPKCGSAVRFRFLEEHRSGEDEKEDVGGYIRPPWRYER